MIIDSKYKIEKAASTDESRYVICSVLLEPGKATATDGRILAQVPVTMQEGEADDLPVVVNAEFIKTMRPRPVAADMEDDWCDDEVIYPDLVMSIKDKRSQVSPSGISAPLIDGNYPNLESTIPKDASTRPVTLRISARLLLNLAEAIGAISGQVELCMDQSDAEAAVIVRPIKSNGAFGLIMPLKNDGK